MCGSANKYLTIETEGSNADKIDWNGVFLASISPKLDNSDPIVGSVGPNGKIVTQRQADMHYTNRLQAIRGMKYIMHAVADFQIKPVVSSVDELKYIVRFLARLFREDTTRDTVSAYNELLFRSWCLNNVYLMPAGNTEEQLQLIRADLMEYCWKEGYNYTDRMHITAYGTKRGV